MLEPLDSVKLGRLHTNIPVDLGEHHDSPCSPPPHRISELKDIDEAITKSADPKIRGAFANICSARYDKQQSTERRIKTVKAKIYTMQAPHMWLSKAIEQESTREWLGRCIDTSEKVWLITGYITVQDAAVTYKSETHPTSKLKLGSQSAAGARATPHAGKTVTSSSFTALGERVLAQQFRNVVLSRESKSDSELASLEKCATWKDKEGSTVSCFGICIVEAPEQTQQDGGMAAEEESKHPVCIAQLCEEENWNGGQEEEELPREVFEVEGFRFALRLEESDSEL
ncbi:MAG: hypothetical protein Q9208_002894 [Pyrenodesmia sp. 3 TL-2023]